MMGATYQGKAAVGGADVRGGGVAADPEEGVVAGAVGSGPGSVHGRRSITTIALTWIRGGRSGAGCEKISEAGFGFL